MISATRVHLSCLRKVCTHGSSWRRWGTAPSVTMNTYSHVIPALRREVAAKMDEILKPVAVSVAVSAKGEAVQ